MHVMGKQGDVHLNHRLTIPFAEDKPSREHSLTTGGLPDARSWKWLGHQEYCCKTSAQGHQFPLLTFRETMPDRTLRGTTLGEDPQ